MREVLCQCYAAQEPLITHTAALISSHFYATAYLDFKYSMCQNMNRVGSITLRNYFSVTKQRR
jgi:hypothetical protein